MGQNVANIAQTARRSPATTTALTRANRYHVFPESTSVESLARQSFLLRALTTSPRRQRRMNALVSKVRAAGGNCGVAVLDPAFVDAEGQHFLCLLVRSWHARTNQTAQVASWHVASPAARRHPRQLRQRTAQPRDAFPALPFYRRSTLSLTRYVVACRAIQSSTLGRFLKCDWLSSGHDCH
jgi:hypothetical protein